MTGSCQTASLWHMGLPESHFNVCTQSTPSLCRDPQFHGYGTKVVTGSRFSNFFIL